MMLTITSAMYLSSGVLRVALADEAEGGMPVLAWVMIIIIIVLAVWMLWWWITSSRKKGETPAQPAPSTMKATEPSPAPVAAAAPAVVAAPVPVKPDDLTVIEGIGPKIAGVLQAAGIATFGQLADADASKLDRVLKDAGLNLADPSSWGEQAGLAAAGKWDELKTLQDGLKGGRRA